MTTNCEICSEHVIIKEEAQGEEYYQDEFYIVVTGMIICGRCLRGGNGLVEKCSNNNCAQYATKLDPLECSKCGGKNFCGDCFVVSRHKSICKGCIK